MFDRHLEQSSICDLNEAVLDKSLTETNLMLVVVFSFDEDKRADRSDINSPEEKLYYIPLTSGILALHSSSLNDTMENNPKNLPLLFPWWLFLLEVLFAYPQSRPEIWIRK